MKIKNSIIKNRKNQKTGFTLAELLITLGIIGVITVLVVPALLQNINDRNKNERVKNIFFKLSQGTDKMQAQAHIIGYASTEAFVDELSKHMKILQVCKGADVSKCWPYSKIAVNNKKNKKDVLPIDDAGWFKLDTDRWSEPVGIITGDGTPMLLTYDTKCNYDDGTTPKLDRATGKSASLACIAGVFDWNGDAKPNGYGLKNDSDIIPIGTISGVARSNFCSIADDEVGGVCFVGQAFNPTALDCTVEANSEYCGGGQQAGEYDATQDYWAGANKQCIDSNSHMPTREELTKLAKYLYNNDSIGDGDNYQLTAKLERFAELGLPNLAVVSDIRVFDDSANNRLFLNTMTRSQDGIGRSGYGLSAYYGICVAD